MIRRRTDVWLKRPTSASFLPKTADLQGVWVGWSDGQDAVQSTGEALSAGRFEFLGQDVIYSDQIKWDDPDVSHLWRYHLHYFGYLEDVAAWGMAGSRAEAYKLFRRLVESWIDHHQLIKGDGWHPYTLSLRLVNWIQCALVFDAELKSEPDFRNRLLRSMWRQGEILYRDREFDVRGNHLLENLRALIWLGKYFDEPVSTRWLEAAWANLETETAEQVLADGGHFERSPGYHLVVMKDLVEIGWLPVG